MISTLEEIKLDSLEYAYLISDTKYNSAEFPLWVPKLLPLVPSAAIQAANVAIDNNIFINEEKPQTPTTIPTRNYLSVPKFRQADFEYKLEDFSADITIKKGTKFMVTIMHGNIKDIYVTDNI
jgi:hypothetical protein